MGKRPDTDEFTSYSPDEIEQRSGFDRRTISYYVQEGLLPRVGRRGPNTRYPQSFLDRLEIIKRLKRLQDSGRMQPISLREMSILFDRLSDDKIAALASGEEALDVIDFRLDRPPQMASARTRAANRMDPFIAKYETPDNVAAFSLAEPADRQYEQEVENKYEQLSRQLQSLARLARSNARRSGTAIETWSRTAITPDILLSVKGLADEDVETLEQLARLLQEALEHK